jgi:hypothetical protein
LGIEKRIKALGDRHAAVDAQIQLLQCCPGHDPLAVRKLKKEKLHLKDEIVRLKNPNRLTAPKSMSKAHMKKQKKAEMVGTIHRLPEPPVVDPDQQAAA